MNDPENFRPSRLTIRDIEDFEALFDGLELLDCDSDFLDPDPKEPDTTTYEN